MHLGICANSDFGAQVPVKIVRSDRGNATIRVDQRPLVIVSYNPDPNRSWNSAPDPGRYADLAAQLAEKHKHRAIAYEIWNEPNLSQFWTSPDPVRYAKCFNAAQKAILSVDPNAKILAGGLADAKDIVSYTTKLLAHADPEILAVHPYVFRKGSFLKMKRFGLPVAVTEYGVHTSVPSAQRSILIRDSIRFYRDNGAWLTTLYSAANDPDWVVPSGVFRGF